MPATQRIETRISPDLLNTMGKSFRFSHGKGIAEWLKNSLDHYLRLRNDGLETMSGAWPVFVNLMNAPSRDLGPNLAVLDLGGTSFANIEQFFLYWGDTSAATFGGRSSVTGLTGGHGNGGKFYMREMWRDGARLLTWRDGHATSLIVDKAQDGTTGAWEFKDEVMDWRAALSFALTETGLGGPDWAIDCLTNGDLAGSANGVTLAAELDNGLRGFTVIVGRRAEQKRTTNDVVKRKCRWDDQRLVDDIRNAPQAHRPIRELRISIFEDGELRIPQLHLETIEEDPDWLVETVSVPSDVLVTEDLTLAADPAGTFTLRKAAEQLNGRRNRSNAIQVSDADGNPIASYPLDEIPLPGHSIHTGFLFGELQLTFSGVRDIVENDRERLIRGPLTTSILDWVADNIWQRVRQLEKQQRDSRRNSQLEIASLLNQQLNRHAERFLKELETEIMVDVIQDPVGGGEGEDHIGGGPTGQTKSRAASSSSPPPANGDGPVRPGTGSRQDTPGQKEVPGAARPARRPQFPRVLLSGFDPNPASLDGAVKNLSSRHPPVSQDDEDKLHNVWWINTSHPFAVAALRRGGAQGPWFKGHHLYMFVQVIQKEGLRLQQRREAELGLDIVESELDRYANNFLAQLPHDLVDALLGAESSPEEPA